MIHPRILPLFLSAALLAAPAGCERAPSNPADPPAAPTPPVTRTLPSGLTITDHAPGSGEPCPPAARVTIRFTAKLADGTVWDSTEQRKAPLTMELSSPGLIAGLREGIIGMRPGARRTLNIPHRLGYGDLGREPVPPKTDLVFEVELIRWEPGEAQATGNE